MCTQKTKVENMTEETRKSKAVIKRQIEAAQKEIDENNRRNAEKAEALKKLLEEKKHFDAIDEAKAAAAARVKLDRQKFLIGAMAISHMAKDSAYKAKVIADLNVYLDKNRDRALFDLPLLETPKAKPSEPVQSPKPVESPATLDALMAAVLKA